MDCPPISSLSGKFPGGTLGKALADPVPLADGGKDLYIRPEKFRQQFAADVAPQQAAAMAVAQRPVTVAALNEAATGAAWKQLPSYFVYGTADRHIPLQAQRFMAERAQARDIVEVKGASHVVMVSHPEAVAKLIEEAAGFGGATTLLNAAQLDAVKLRQGRAVDFWTYSCITVFAPCPMFAPRPGNAATKAWP